MLLIEVDCCCGCKHSLLQLEDSRFEGKHPGAPHNAKLKSVPGNMWAERLLCSQILEYRGLGMPEDEHSLDMRDLELARSKLFGAPYSHPLKPPIAPSAPFEIRKIPYGAYRDAAFADLIGVDNGFICGLLKYRYKKTPAVQGMQLKDITILIWHYQTNRHVKVAAPWPKTPPEQIDMIESIIQDLGHAVTLRY